MKVYKGKRTGDWVEPQDVTVDGEPLEHQVRHSPTGFEWGYGGSGPADLALSLLWDCCGERIATKWYQHFKWEVVAHLPWVEWLLTQEDIRVALDAIWRRKLQY